MFPFAQVRLFWCVWTSSPTRSVTLPTSAKIIPFGIERSASASLPGTVSLSSANRAEPSSIRYRSSSTAGVDSRTVMRMSPSVVCAKTSRR